MKALVLQLCDMICEGETEDGDDATGGSDDDAVSVDDESESGSEEGAESSEEEADADVEVVLQMSAMEALRNIVEREQQYISTLCNEALNRVGRQTEAMVRDRQDGEGAIFELDQCLIEQGTLLTAALQPGPPPPPPAQELPPSEHGRGAEAEAERSS